MPTDAQTVQTLQQWADDAATTFTNWPTMTAGQKDAAQRETIRRLGIMCTHIADRVLENRYGA